MYQDGGRKAESEHDPEKIHAAEPAVDNSEWTLVLMSVAEECIGCKNRSSDSPARYMIDPRLKCTKRGEVRDWAGDIHVEEFRDSAADEAKQEEVGDCTTNDVVHEEQPPKTDLLTDAGDQASSEPAGQDILGVSIDERWVRRREGLEACDLTPPQMKTGTPA